ncbi:zinc-ribbon domain-containing protein [Pontibacter sp. H249]|uniref:zinc-ribbon domain-containing protein n=1 Tax=Pontibacter sp. H249 TaxID=3133420 RepID=UPI0030BC286F
MSSPDQIQICKVCGARVAAEKQVCPKCGSPLPEHKIAWYKNLTPTEIFLLILGSIMLMVALVAV